MSKREYHNLLARLGIGVAGRVFGVSRAQAIRYSTGTSPIPQPTAKLIRLSARLKLTAADLQEL
jgi:hypothetical protein